VISLQQILQGMLNQGMQWYNCFLRYNYNLQQTAK